MRERSVNDQQPQAQGFPILIPTPFIFDQFERFFAGKNFFEKNFLGIITLKLVS